MDQPDLNHKSFEFDLNLNLALPSPELVLPFVKVFLYYAARANLTGYCSSRLKLVELVGLQGSSG